MLSKLQKIYIVDTRQVSKISKIYIRGSHTFSRVPEFSENEKVGRENGSQWGVPAPGGCVTPRFGVASKENEIWRMRLQACSGWVIFVL